MELRKDICSTCGWTKLIKESEELRLAPPRHGTKEIKFCQECVDARGSTDPVKRLQFEQNYAYAARGTQGKVWLRPEDTKPQVPSASITDIQKRANEAIDALKPPDHAARTEQIETEIQYRIAVRYFVRGFLFAMLIWGVIIMVVLRHLNFI